MPVYNHGKQEITSLSLLYNHSKNNPSHVYNHGKEEISFTPPPTPVHFLEDVKWVAIGDSLTDPTATGGNGRRYDYYLNSLTGVQNTNLGVGGTGYWSTYGAGNCFYQRAENSNDLNADTNIVTVFGSINDHKAKNGNTLTGDAAISAGRTRDSGSTVSFDTIFNAGASEGTYGNWWYVKGITLKNYPNLNHPMAILDTLDYTETVTSDDAAGKSRTYIAFVNEVIDIVHRKAPNAKVVIVSEVFAWGGGQGLTYDVLFIEMMIKKKIVEYRQSQGDTWLSYVDLWNDDYAGIYGTDNPYCNIYPNVGLSAKQCTANFGDYDFSGFASRYFEVDKMHPKNQYNYEWLAVKFGQIICDALDIDRSQLPTGEAMIQAMSQYPELSPLT